MVGGVSLYGVDGVLQWPNTALRDSVHVAGKYGNKNLITTDLI